MRVRARITDPAPGVDHRRRHLHRARQGLVGHRAGHRRRRQLHRRGRLAPGDGSSRPTGPYQWQDWSFDWEADDIGRHTLRARATDAAGNVQPDVPPWNRLGYGNNAIEVIYVDVGHFAAMTIVHGTLTTLLERARRPHVMSPPSRA